MDETFARMRRAVPWALAMLWIASISPLDGPSSGGHPLGQGQGVPANRRPGRRPPPAALLGPVRLCQGPTGAEHLCAGGPLGTFGSLGAPGGTPTSLTPVRVDRGLSSGPTGSESLAVLLATQGSRGSRDTVIAQSVALEAEGRLEEARTLLEDAQGRWSQDAGLTCRLAKVSLYLKDYDRALNLLEEARRHDPDDPLVDAVEGLYLFCLRDTAQALASVRRALKRDPDLKEAYLIQADVLFAIRDMAGARSLLEGFLTRFPADPDGLYLMGIVCFYQRDLKRAQDFLERARSRSPTALNVRKDLVQVYSLTGRIQDAITLLETLVSERPGDKALAALHGGLSQRLKLQRSGKRLVKGALDVAYPAQTSKATLDRIVGLFLDASAELKRRRGVAPTRVRVTILDTTDQLLPAYYNHVSDEITISRQYYEGLDTRRKQELGRHLVFHEFSHLALYQELGDVSLPPAALWLVEGLAEFEAGGYTYTHVDYEETFRDGLLDLEILEEYLPVSAMAKGKVREKAYIQSYAMAAYMMDSLGDGDGLAKVKEMALAYTRYGPDHERVVSEILGASPAQLLRATSGYIRRNLSGETASRVPPASWADTGATE